jgi:hypothetical protein
VLHLMPYAGQHLLGVIKETCHCKHTVGGPGESHDPLGPERRHRLARNPGWAAQAGFDGHPDTTKPSRILQLLR